MAKFFLEHCDGAPAGILKLCSNWGMARGAPFLPTLSFCNSRLCQMLLAVCAVGEWTFEIFTQKNAHIPSHAHKAVATKVLFCS